MLLPRLLLCGANEIPWMGKCCCFLSVLRSTSSEWRWR